MEKTARKTHKLKVWKEYYQDLNTGRKTFELRKNDRDYEVGDQLDLFEYDKDKNEFTGDHCHRFITYILGANSFIDLGDYVILGLSMDYTNQKQPTPGNEITYTEFSNSLRKHYSKTFDSPDFDKSIFRDIPRIAFIWDAFKELIDSYCPEQMVLPSDEEIAIRYPFQNENEASATRSLSRIQAYNSRQSDRREGAKWLRDTYQPTEQQNSGVIGRQSKELILKLLQNDLNYCGKLTMTGLDEQSEHELGLSIGKTRMAITEIKNLPEFKTPSK